MLLFLEEQVTIKNKFSDIERRLELLLSEQQRDDNELPTVTSTTAATKNRRFAIFYEFYQCQCHINAFMKVYLLLTKCSNVDQRFLTLLLIRKKRPSI